MNNILTFEDYKKMSIRQVESVIYRQFMEDSIENDEAVNEGFIRNFINKRSSKFIQSALGDEIEKGKELEKSIKEALDGLNKGFAEVEKSIEGDADSNSKIAAIEKVKEAIKAVQSQAFDTLTMIGSEGEIDFAGFMGSASVAAAANFGILFSPIRSIFMTRKAYKYFLSIIKQTIRRNLLVIQLNFDQFENLILQKSFENEDSEYNTKRDTIRDIIAQMTEQLCGPESKLKVIKGDSNIKNMRGYLDNLKKAQDIDRGLAKSSPFRSLWEDQHNNTYTRTLEQIKQYINDDSQKELEALKNSITKMAGSDPDLVPYGELLISAAEEYAIHTNHGINNNFIKMSSVFNLDNQKKLIELIVKAQEENEEEIKKKMEEIDIEEHTKEVEGEIEEGKEICEKKLEDSTETYTIEEFEEMFGDDVTSIMAYLMSDKGRDTYKKINKRNPTYKYYIGDITSLNTLLSSINDLKIVEVSDMDDFYDSIVHKDQTLYHMMAEQSIDDAIKSRKSEDYFGFQKIKKDKDNILTVSDDEKNEILDSIIGKKTIIEKGKRIKTSKKKYFLTFNGDGNELFTLLHKDFKTRIFKGSKSAEKEYVENISLKNKEDLMKIIHKYLGIGKSVTSKFAEYLVRLEAHMLLDKKEPWFVVENNKELFGLNCFKTNSRKILNKTAFVEISQEDYEDIKIFLTKYHSLSDNDFLIENEEKPKRKTRKKK